MRIANRHDIIDILDILDSLLPFLAKANVVNYAI